MRPLCPDGRCTHSGYRQQPDPGCLFLTQAKYFYSLSRFTSFPPPQFDNDRAVSGVRLVASRAAGERPAISRHSRHPRH
jgi:hypothetical protein